MIYKLVMGTKEEKESTKKKIEDFKKSLSKDALRIIGHNAKLVEDEKNSLRQKVEKEKEIFEERRKRFDVRNIKYKNISINREKYLLRRYNVIRYNVNNIML